MKNHRLPAGQRDLSAAVAKVHSRPNRKNEPLDPGTVDVALMLAAGDAEDRETYFDFDDRREVVVMDGKPIHMTMSRGALIHDYRDLEFRRRHRVQATIPPKLRHNIRNLFGVDKDDDFLITTSLIALADYATWVLRRDNKRLHVEPADDPDAQARKALRKRILRSKS